MCIMNGVFYCKAGKKYFSLGLLVAEISVQAFSLCKPSTVRNKEAKIYNQHSQTGKKKAQKIPVVCVITENKCHILTNSLKLTNTISSIFSGPVYNLLTHL